MYNPARSNNLISTKKKSFIHWKLVIDLIVKVDRSK